jgi:putative FmdB family regulatory protein
MPPIYDFKCQLCGLSFEQKQDADDKQDLKCSDPLCQGYAVRCFPLTSFKLLGKGWHSSDYS